MEFDTIIVGAGSAGCVLAEQLSQDGRQSILVLEAGPGDRRFWIHVPLGYGKNYYNRSVNWAYETEPDPGLGNRSDYWPRGKVLGGSSSINAMVFIRGHAQDYDDWRDAGNPGWGWQDVLPHFRAIEDNQAGADEWRATGGRLHVSDVSAKVAPYCTAFIEAGTEAGLSFNRDFNGRDQEGVGYYQITTKKSRRMSAARAFLRPAMQRHNVKVETRAQVLRIGWTGDQVDHVVYQQNGKEHTARARREIIVSAGAVNTPQLLMLSGIGDGETLARNGIAVRHHNPNVGRHLQDHLGINYVFGVTQPTLNEKLGTWSARMVAGAHYLLGGRGPLSLSINHGGGFFRTNPQRPRANMQLYFQAMSIISRKHEGERPVLNPDPFPAVAIGLSSCRPTSRGTITLRSPDPLDPPLIYPQSFSTDHDLEEMLEGVKFLRVLANQPALRAVITRELQPGDQIATDEELIADIRARCGTVFHPSCTCRMGPDPAGSVVDNRLKMHGVAGLRIVDASVFPNIVSGNTNGPTIMTAHKAARLIAEEG